MCGKWCELATCVFSWDCAANHWGVLAENADRDGTLLTSRHAGFQKCAPPAFEKSVRMYAAAFSEYLSYLTLKNIRISRSQELRSLMVSFGNCNAQEQESLYLPSAMRMHMPSMICSLSVT